MKFNEIKKTDNEFIAQTYNRYEVCFVKGNKSKLYDTEGKEYTDFLAGVAVNALGYNDKDLNNTIKSNLPLLHASNHFYIDTQAQLAKLLCEGTHFKKVFISNSGAESIECAIKLARKYFYDKGINKYKFITAKNSFHGRTLAAVTATGQEKFSKPYAPLVPGFSYAEYNSFDDIVKLYDDQTCAVMLETIQGEGGVIEAEPEYIKKAYEFTQKKGILLILDEIQTGMGRTGKFYSYEHYAIKPDILALSKALGGGYPIGAVLMNEKLQNTFTYGDHGTTFGGNRMACACAVTAANKIKNGLTQTAHETGLYFKNKLKKNFKKFAVSGRGLMLGLKLPDTVPARDIVKKMLEKGFIINAAGNNTLRFIPPLIIKKSEITAMVNALKEIVNGY